MEVNNKKSYFRIILIVVLVLVIALILFIFGKDFFSSKEVNSIELSKMTLSVGNEVEIDLGDLNLAYVDTISYSSKDENIAIINEKGMITAVNNGVTDIVVIYNSENVTYEKNVNVVVSSRGTGVVDSSNITLDYALNDGVKENVWTNQNVSITVNSNSNVKYAIDCDADCKYIDLLENKTINIATEGSHIVTIVAFDDDDNSLVKKVNVKIDKTKPICKFVQGPTPNEIYVGDSATYVFDCIDEKSRINVINDINFLDVVLPSKFTYVNDSIVDVVEKIYEKTKNTAIKVENIDDGYRYTLSVTGLKPGKTKIELPQGVFVDYAGNIQEKAVSKEITVIDKNSGNGGEQTYPIKCNLTYDNGILTGSGSSSNELSYYGFSSTYSGSNETTKQVTKEGTYTYYVKDSKGNTRSCKVVVEKKDLPPSCGLKYYESKKLLVGNYADNSGSGIAYYGFSSTYSGESSSELSVSNSKTYYFYVKDNNGNTAVCDEDVKIPLEKPTCKLSYNNGLLIGTPIDNNGSGFKYAGFRSDYNGNSVYTKRITDAGTYYFYVKDHNDLTGSCSIEITKDMLGKLECNLSFELGQGLYYYVTGPTTDGDGNTLAYYGFSSTYSGKNENSKPVYKPDTYTYYVMDKNGNKGSCSINTADKPSCSLTFSDQGLDGCVYLNVDWSSGSKYGAYIVSKGFKNCSGCSSEIKSGIVKVCGQKQYTFSVTDIIGNTSSCSIDVSNYIKEKTPSCSLNVEIGKGQYYYVTGPTTDSDGNQLTYYGFSSSYSGKLENTMPVYRPDTYTYYIMDKNGNKGSCSINTADKPTCSLTVQDIGENGCVYLRVNRKGGTKYGAYIISGRFENCSNCTKTDDSLVYKACGQKQYTYSVTDIMGNTGSCSITLNAKPSCELKLEVIDNEVYLKSILKNDNIIQKGFTKYDNTSSKKINKAGVYHYYVKDSNGNEGVCTIDVASKTFSKPSCTLTYANGVLTSTIADGNGSGFAYYGFNSNFSGNSVKTLKVEKDGTYYYYVKDKLGYIASCSYTVSNFSNNTMPEKVNCAAGTYEVNGHCVACPAGSYCSQNKAIKCPTGYESKAGAKYQNECYIRVDGGYHLAYPTSTTKVKCAVGYYNEAHNVNYGSSSSCKKCPDGYNYGSAGAASLQQCMIRVDEGKYLSKAKSTTQSTCSAGTESELHYVSYGSISSCQKCSKDYYCVDGSKYECPKEYPNSNLGSSSKEQCYVKVDAGYYLPSVGAEAEKCESNTYSSQAKTVYYGNTSSCERCPAGYKFEDRGSTSILNCYIDVEAGKYLKTSQSANTFSCEKGTYKEAHRVYYGNVSKCKSCDSGTTTSGKGATSESDCSVSSCVRSPSCGCEEYVKGWHYQKTEIIFGKCFDDPSDGPGFRCTGTSSSNNSSGYNNCTWTCKRYKYEDYCKSYYCCEVNKGENFEFNLINYDFINDMIYKTLSGMFK